MTTARPGLPALIVPLIALSGCNLFSDDPRAAFRDLGLQRSYDSVAQAVARVLASPGNRAILVDSMKSSLRETHAIDLMEYLRSLPDEIPARSEALDRLLQEPIVRDLELALPVSRDRVTWEATDDIVVTSETPMPADTSAELSTDDSILNLRLSDFYSVGYKTDDSQLLFLPTDPIPFPLLLVRRKTSDNRAFVDSSDMDDRSTVSTIAEEYLVGVDVPMGSRADQQFRNRARTLFPPHDCFNRGGEDIDADGLSDACEYEIAHAFRPVLLLDKDEDNADRQTYWEVRIADGELTEQDAERRPVSQLWLFYALGYYYDGGRWGLTWHHGDTEFIVMSVAPVGEAPGDSLWAMTKICYAAHWDARGEFHKCYFADDEVVQYDDTREGRPMVWVAYNKHGNYPNERTCRDKRLFLWVKELCRGSFKKENVEVLEHRQLGRYYPSTPTSIEEERKYRTGVERLWSADKFCGWHRYRSMCAGNYLRALRAWQFAPDPATRWER